MNTPSRPPEGFEKEPKTFYIMQIYYEERITRKGVDK